MELWIRSQDKKLLCKCDSLFIEEEPYKRKGKYRIMANKGWLGEYDKLERTLEVLDEIQRKIKPEYMLRNINRPDEPSQYEGYYEEKPTIIYEMPEE